MLRITTTKLFSRPNILITSIYPIFHQNKSNFWTPCMAKIAFYELNISIFEKGSTNLTYHRVKTFQDTQYFYHFHTYQFSHQNSPFHIFWTPCMAKIASYQIYLFLQKKSPQMHHTTKTKIFNRPNIFIISIHLNFFTKIRSLCIFGHLVVLE